MWRIKKQITLIYLKAKAIIEQYNQTTSKMVSTTTFQIL